MRLLKAIAIYLDTQFSWPTAWRHAGENTPKHIDAPVRAVKGEDGLDYVEIQVRFVP
jgi:hypothetical protein